MSDQHLSDRKTIVVVDDDEMNREVLQEIISSMTPYKAWALENDIEALQRIEEIKTTRPILFILDYLLTGMNALELFDAFQKVEELQAIPTLIVTASSPDPTDQELAKRGLHIMAKPFELETLVNAINQLVTVSPP